MATKKAAAPAAKKPAAKAAPTTAKKAAPAKPAVKAAAPAIRPIGAPMTKSGLMVYLAEQSDVEPKQVKKVMAALEGAILGSLHKKGLGQFTLPGIAKIVAQKVPAKPKRKGKNPFTGEEQVFAAKPATVRVRVRPLKKLKDAPL